MNFKVEEELVLHITNDHSTKHEENIFKNFVIKFDEYKIDFSGFCATNYPSVSIIFSNSKTEEITNTKNIYLGYIDEIKIKNNVEHDNSCPAVTVNFVCNENSVAKLIFYNLGNDGFSNIFFRFFDSDFMVYNTCF